MKKLIFTMLFIALLMDGTAKANLTATEGLAIDLSSAGAGTDMTVAFDPTELLGNRTWGDGSTDTIVWTWNRATGTDPTVTFGSALVTVGGGLTATLDLIITGGDITLGTTSIFSGGDVASLNNIDAIDATTETTFEAAIDALANLVTVGTIGTGVWQGTAIADGYVPDNITIDLATLATTVTVSDDESTADAHEVVFTTDNTNLESDGTFTYNPSTGTVTTTQFVGGGAGLTGTVTAYDDIGNPDNAGLTTITFDNAELSLLTGDNDAAASFFILQNTDADHTGGNFYLLDLDYSADDGDADADFIKCQDSGSTVLTVQEDGKIVMTPSGVGSLNAIDITPSAALSTNEAIWNGLYVDATALDPSGNDIGIHGLHLDMSGVAYGGTGGDLDGLKVVMADGEAHAIHVSEGKIVVANTADSAAGAEYTVVDIQLDTSSLHANSAIHALDVATVGTPSGTVVALGTHSNIEVIQQSVGTFSTPSQTEYAGEKHTGGTVWADGVDASEIFVADDDEVYVGSASVFSEIEVTMTTPGTKTVTPTFHYNTAADTWTEFFPADDTDGFQMSGIVRWTLSEISGSWTNNGDPCGVDTSTGYWIKIIRTANADPGTPTPTTVKTGAITSYSWSKTGAIDALSVEGDTLTEGGVAVHNNDEMDASSELLAIFDDETGTGVIVFGTSPTLVTPALGTPSALVGTNITGTGASFTAGTATLATTVTISDNESTAENNPIVFVAGADPDGGSLGLETDGTCYYTPSTGVITTTGFVGALTGAVTGNASTATALETTRAIGGVNFDGTAAITPTTIVVADTTDTAAYIGIWEDATGSLLPKTDGAATYNAGTGTITATEFSGGGASLTAIDAATGDSATAFFDAGTVEHEYGGLEADISTWTGLLAITGGATAEVDSKSELEGHIADVADFAEADGDVYTGTHDFGGADLEIPQASPAVPAVDGGVEVDFTDGSVVIQHGSAHAELGASTDVVVGKLVGSFSATLGFPDLLQAEIDNWPLKAIESTEFPHGIVITRIRLKTSASSTYAVNVENWDDPTTINGGNPTIDAITTSASTEATEDTITYSTIAAGQIIMLDLPTTDIGWFTIQVEYYEPAA